MTRTEDPRPGHLPEPTYITTVLGDGSVCPISEILGRRRVRRINAGSVEGKRLLRSGRVTVLARDGRRFEGVPIARVFDDLAGELSAEARDPETDPRIVADLTDLAAAIERQRRAFS